MMLSQLLTHKGRWLADHQEWLCYWCGQKMTRRRDKHNSVTVEHLVPRWIGGSG